MKKSIFIAAVVAALFVSCSSDDSSSDCNCVYEFETRQYIRWSNGDETTPGAWSSDQSTVDEPADCDDAQLVMLSDTEQVNGDGTLVTEHRKVLNCD